MPSVRVAAVLDRGTVREVVVEAEVQAESQERRQEIQDPVSNSQNYNYAYLGWWRCKNLENVIKN